MAKQTKHAEFWVDVGLGKANDWEGVSIHFTDMKRKGKWSQTMAFWLSDIYLKPKDWELRRKSKSANIAPDASSRLMLVH
jgi:hypothetical protein